MAFLIESDSLFMYIGRSKLPLRPNFLFLQPLVEAMLVLSGAAGGSCAPNLESKVSICLAGGEGFREGEELSARDMEEEEGKLLSSFVYWALGRT